MSWYSIGRAVEAAQSSGDGFLEAVGRLLVQVQRTPEIAGAFDHHRRLLAVQRVEQRQRRWDELTGQEGMLPAGRTIEDLVRHEVQTMDSCADLGPVPVMGERTLRQAGRCAHAVLHRLHAGQGGEFWPGQEVRVRDWGRVRVRWVEMDGRYAVQQIGWGTYRDDPIRYVPHADVVTRFVPDGEDRYRGAPVEYHARELARLVRTTPRDNAGFTYGRQEANEVLDWCELLESA